MRRDAKRASAGGRLRPARSAGSHSFTEFLFRILSLRSLSDCTLSNCVRDSILRTFCPQKVPKTPRRTPPPMAYALTLAQGAYSRVCGETAFHHSRQPAAAGASKPAPSLALLGRTPLTVPALSRGHFSQITGMRHAKRREAGLRRRRLRPARSADRIRLQDNFFRVCGSRGAMSR